MSKVFFFLCLSIMGCCGIASAQNTYNFDFETVNAATALPEGISSKQLKTYSFSVDSLIRQHGKIFPCAGTKRSKRPVRCVQLFLVKPAFRGQKLTLKGFIRTETVTGFAGLWARVDGNSGVLSLNNMQSSGIKRHKRLEGIQH